MKELDLTDEQKSNLKDFEKKFEETRDRTLKEIREKRDQARKAMPDRNAPDFESHVEESNRLSEQHDSMSLKLVEEFDIALLRKVFDRRQGDRLKEIRLQADGPAAFMRPDVQESLGMDPDQITDIRRIRSEGRRAVMTLVVHQI